MRTAIVVLQRGIVERHLRTVLWPGIVSQTMGLVRLYLRMGSVVLLRQSGLSISGAHLGIAALQLGTVERHLRIALWRGIANQTMGLAKLPLQMGNVELPRQLGPFVLGAHPEIVVQ